MKIKAIRSKLLGGINAVKDVVKGTDEKNPFRNIRVETVDGGIVLLTGSNGDVQIQSRVFCEAQGECAMTLVGASFCSFVGAMAEGPIDIEDAPRSGRVKISCAFAEFSIQPGDVADFPLMKGPDAEKQVVYSLPAMKLREILRKVGYAACRDKTRISLGGVLVRTTEALPGMASTLDAVATDGRRLSHVQCEIANTRPVDAILTLETVGVLRKLLGTWPEDDVDVACDGKSIRFTSKLWSVTAKLVDGAYPNWEKVVPADGTLPHDVEVERETLAENLKRAKLSTFRGNCQVKLVFSKGELACEATNGFSRARAVMPVRFGDERVQINMDPDILLDVLDAVDEDTVHLQFMDGKHPVAVRCSLPFVGVLMPMVDIGEA